MFQKSRPAGPKLKTVKRNNQYTETGWVDRRKMEEVDIVLLLKSRKDLLNSSKLNDVRYKDLVTNCLSTIIVLIKTTLMTIMMVIIIIIIKSFVYINKRTVLEIHYCHRLVNNT